MSIDLLVVDETLDLEAVAVFGGLPPIPDGTIFTWPVCVPCGGPLQYQGGVPHPADPAKRILVFQCNSDAGLCDQWDPEAGGNLALVVDVGTVTSPVQQPTVGSTVLGAMWSCHVETVIAATYGQAHSAQASGRRTLGSLHGQPDWIQADETPTRPACGQSMMLAAHLEEGPDYYTAMNFGGGCGYVFACGCPAGQARFLWQCG